MAPIETESNAKYKKTGLSNYLGAGHCNLHVLLHDASSELEWHERQLQSSLSDQRLLRLSQRQRFRLRQSPSSPFQTLGKAQRAMQRSSIKATYPTTGTYNLSSTFTLTSSDNGETWAAYPSDPPNSAILDGGSTSSSNGLAVVFAIFGV